MFLSFFLSFFLYKHAQKVIELYSKLKCGGTFHNRRGHIARWHTRKFRAHVNHTQKAVDHFEFSSQAPPTALMDFKIFMFTVMFSSVYDY